LNKAPPIAHEQVHSDARGAGRGCHIEKIG
jgi:hypothetical protein